MPYNGLYGLYPVFLVIICYLPSIEIYLGQVRIFIVISRKDKHIYTIKKIKGNASLHNKNSPTLSITISGSDYFITKNHETNILIHNTPIVKMWYHVIHVRLYYVICMVCKMQS